MHTDIDRWRVVVYIVSGFVVGLRQLSQYGVPLNVSYIADDIPLTSFHEALCSTSLCET